VLVACVALVVVVCAIVAWRRHSTTEIRSAVARVCGVPLAIVGQPYAVQEQGRELMRADVDTATLHIRFAHAWALYNPADRTVVCHVG
jgi:hypothetical protein